MREKSVFGRRVDAEKRKSEKRLPKRRVGTVLVLECCCVLRGERRDESKVRNGKVDYI